LFFKQKKKFLWKNLKKTCGILRLRSKEAKPAIVQKLATDYNITLIYGYDKGEGKLLPLKRQCVNLLCPVKHEQALPKNNLPRLAGLRKMSGRSFLTSR
jgi:hypothetical protein